MRRGVPRGLDVVLDRDVYSHCFSRVDREVGGVLVAAADGEQRAIIVGAIPALQAAESAASITFTHEAWASIHRTLDAEFPDGDICGWYHTHPGYGVFLSEQDVFIHRNFFSNPSQIALVIDPVAGTEAIFGWDDGEVVHLLERPTTYSGERLARGRRAEADREPRASSSPPSRERAVRTPSPGRVAPHPAPSAPGVLRASPRSSPSASVGAHTRDSWLSLANCIYLAIIGLSAGVCYWELALR